MAFATAVKAIKALSNSISLYPIIYNLHQLAADCNYSHYKDVIPQSTMCRFNMILQNTICWSLVQKGKLGLTERSTLQKTSK